MDATNIQRSPTVVDELAVTAPGQRDLLARLLDMLREAILDVADGAVCVATLQSEKQGIEISTPHRLTVVQVGQLKKDLQASAGTGPKDVPLVINGHPESEYEFEPHEYVFTEVSTAPLQVRNASVGWLAICSFTNSKQPGEVELLESLQDDLPAALCSLWRQNQRERQKYQSLALAVIDGVILCTLEREILFINRAALQLLAPENRVPLLGKPIGALNADYLTQFLEEALSNGLHEINKVVQPPAAKSKAQLIGVHTELLKSPRQEEIGWMIVLRDVTTTWQNDQMRSALSVASHEIKTPLNSMTGALDTLLEKDLGDLNQQQSRCLEVMRDDIDRLHRLLTDILDLSRFEEGVKFFDRRKEISLDYLVNKVIYSFRTFAKTKEIAVENQIPKNIPTFKGDRDRLQQVISNLLENAIKYSPANAGVQIGADLKNSVLTFWVKDNGVGIAEEDSETIFEKFKQLDNFHDHGERGYGLGLSIARQIIAAAGGRIWVESEVGAGSTFFVTIPV